MANLHVLHALLHHAGLLEALKQHLPDTDYNLVSALCECVNGW
jgi:hypothetical protein